MPDYFPHLKHGLGTQFPIRRSTKYRTVVNAGDLATNLRASDPGAKRIAWWLRYRGLDDDEVGSLQNLFRAVRGPLRPFVFLDPEDNLIAESEDLSKAVWQKSPGLTMGTAGSTPAETQLAYQLSASGGPAEIAQTVAAPASYRWLLSVFARSGSGSAVTLFVRSSSGEESSTMALTSQWKRYSFGGQFWTSGEGIDVGLRLGSGSTAEVAGFQLESQIAPSRYKASGAHNGVYNDARFSQDSIRVTTVAPNCHQVNLIITAPLPE